MQVSIQLNIQTQFSGPPPGKFQGDRQQSILVFLSATTSFFKIKVKLSLEVLFEYLLNNLLLKKNYFYADTKH